MPPILALDTLHPDNYCAHTVESGQQSDHPPYEDTEEPLATDMYVFHSTPRSRSSLSVSSASSISSRSSIADMIQQQNSLITALLQKHDSLHDTVTAVQVDLRETMAHVACLLEKENDAPTPKMKNKRTYPSALHVSCPESMYHVTLI